MAEAQTDKPEILVVDDSKVIRRAAAKMLGDQYIVHEAVDGLDGWQKLEENDRISVVFTDMMMPEMNGIELLDKIRAADDERIAAIPVIMITGQSDSEAAKKEVYEKGATDFISKPFDSVDLLSRAKSYAQLNKKIVELEEKTSHDQLTGLFNAASFEEQGKKAFSFAVRHKTNIATIALEIDGFQNIFLSNGKAVAQQIIIAVGKRIGEIMREEDIAARTGVAKFSLLLPLTNEETARTIVGRVRDSIHKLVFDTGKQKIRLEMAAGIAAHEIEEDIKFEELASRSEQALKQALKDTSGDKLAVYEGGERPRKAAVITDDEIQRAFMLILRGDYYKIPGEHLQAVAQRLIPFMKYVEDQNEEQQTGSG